MITASEAVYGFAAWLTGRKQKVSFGAKCCCAPAAELAGLWCRTNGLPPPRPKAYPKNIKHPKTTE